MYTLARRSASRPEVLRFLKDETAGTGNSTAGIKTFTSREKARTALKTRQREGYFIVSFDVPAPKKAKASK